MFSNKKSGWLKTIEQNKSGPKTKNEVQKEVLLKVEKE
jgi:Ca-activated chloride channel family protein